MKKKQEKRLKKEYWNLVKKTRKLNKFLDKHMYDAKISNKKYRLLRMQYFAMCVYEEVLRVHIEDLGIEL